MLIEEIPLCAHYERLSERCGECTTPDIPDSLWPNLPRMLRIDQLKVGYRCPGLGAVQTTIREPDSDMYLLSFDRYPNPVRFPGDETLRVLPWPAMASCPPAGGR